MARAQGELSIDLFIAAVDENIKFIIIRHCFQTEYGFLPLLITICSLTLSFARVRVLMTSIE